MATEKKSSIPMPKVHSKIPSISKENVNLKNDKNDTENQKTNENAVPSDKNISRKRKLSRIEEPKNDNPKIDTTSNLKPSKFARKSISQTSKLFNRHTLTDSTKSKANTSMTKANTSMTKANTSLTKTNSSITKTNTTTSKTNMNKLNVKSRISSSPNTSKTNIKHDTSSLAQNKSKISSLNHQKNLLKTKSTLSTNSPISKNHSPKNATVKATTNHKNEVKSPETKNNKMVKSKSGILLPRRPRRPGWDVKGQLEDARKDIVELTNHVENSNHLLEEKESEIKEKTEKIEELKLNVETKESTIETIQAEKDKEKIKSQEEIVSRDIKITELQTKCDKLEESYGQFIKEHDSLKENHDLLKSEHEKIKTEFEELTKSNKITIEQLKESKESVEQLSEKVIQREKTINELEEKINNLTNECSRNKKYIQELEDIKNQNGKRIKELEDECERQFKRICDLENECKEKNLNIQELEEQRRFLHNEIQELKGNIRVFCRVRPVLQSELEKSNQESLTPQHITYPKDNDKGITLTQPVESAMGSTSSKAYPFTFDKVFNATSQQKEIFTEIAQLVQSALDGYNVCIFAYGQTGSGKTYTMEGGNDENTMGMIPRAVQQIFVASEEFKKKGWLYDIDCQFLEIYNETIRDLLENDETKRHDIKHLSNGRTIVTEAKIVQVTTSEEVHKLLQIASKNRSVGATLCNERSSRSHSIFTLHLSGHNSLTNEKYESSLNLIDLAGSERLAVSGATGDRLKETRAINKSLSCLSDVIAALGNNEPHIPYRNSKLTYLLQNSLGGNSKTLMFVNISPLYANLQETLCSLRFATKVNSCQIGTAKKISK